MKMFVDYIKCAYGDFIELEGVFTYSTKLLPSWKLNDELFMIWDTLMYMFLYCSCGLESLYLMTWDVYNLSPELSGQWRL